MYFRHALMRYIPTFGGIGIARKIGNQTQPNDRK